MWSATCLIEICLLLGSTFQLASTTSNKIGFVEEKVFLDNPCDPKNVTNIQEACEPEYTSLICSSITLTCTCPDGEPLPGGRSRPDRRIRMKWIAEVSQCMGLAESGCDSAGDSMGQITCMPGYICAQLDCEKEGNGVCLGVIDDTKFKYDTSKFCKDGGNTNSAFQINITSTILITSMILSMVLHLF